MGMVGPELTVVIHHTTDHRIQILRQFLQANAPLVNAPELVQHPADRLLTNHTSWQQLLLIAFHFRVVWLNRESKEVKALLVFLLRTPTNVHNLGLPLMHTELTCAKTLLDLL